MSNKQVGKRYWRRDGGLTLPLVDGPTTHWSLKDPMTGGVYTSNGCCLSGSCDLLDEYVEPPSLIEKCKRAEKLLADRGLCGSEYHMDPERWAETLIDYMDRCDKMAREKHRQNPSPLTEAEREVVSAAKEWYLSDKEACRRPLIQALDKLWHLEQRQSNTVSIQEARESGGAVLFINRQANYWGVRLDIETPSVFYEHYLLPEKELRIDVTKTQPPTEEQLLALGCKRVRMEEG